MQGRFVANYRVSTDRQGRPEMLGLAVPPMLLP
jgi:hypothetical protein